MPHVHADGTPQTARNRGGTFYEVPTHILRPFNRPLLHTNHAGARAPPGSLRRSACANTYQLVRARTRGAVRSETDTECTYAYIYVYVCINAHGHQRQFPRTNLEGFYCVMYTTHRTRFHDRALARMCDKNFYLFCTCTQARTHTLAHTHSRTLSRMIYCFNFSASRQLRGRALLVCFSAGNC